MYHRMSGQFQVANLVEAFCFLSPVSYLFSRAFVCRFTFTLRALELLSVLLPSERKTFTVLCRRNVVFLYRIHQSLRSVKLYLRITHDSNNFYAAKLCTFY